MVDFLHQSLRPIDVRDSVTEETIWYGLLSFYFTNVQLFSVSQFMEKVEVRTKTIRNSEGWISVERERNKKAETDTVASAFMGDMLNSHVDQARAYIRYVCKELSKHPTFKSDWWWDLLVSTNPFFLIYQKVELQDVVPV